MKSTICQQHPTPVLDSKPSQIAAKTNRPRITRHLSPAWKAEFGLTVISWRVMAVIGRFAPVSAKQVAARTSTDAFFVARAIDKLVEQGYVQKDVDHEDRRRLRLSLTPSGKKVHRQVEDMINAVEAELLAGIELAP